MAGSVVSRKFSLFGWPFDGKYSIVGIFWLASLT